MYDTSRATFLKLQTEEKNIKVSFYDFMICKYKLLSSKYSYPSYLKIVWMFLLENTFGKFCLYNTTTTKNISLFASPLIEKKFGKSRIINHKPEQHATNTRLFHWFFPK